MSQNLGSSALTRNTTWPLTVSETNLSSFCSCVCIAQKPMQVTKEERIAALEAEIQALNAKKMTTTAA